MERTGSSGKDLAGVDGTEGGRRPTGVPSTTAATAVTGSRLSGSVSRPDPEVPEQAVRRRFTMEYKLAVVEQADGCTESGQLGALLRREGLYSSQLSSWRKQRREGMLSGLTPKKRGRKAKRKDPLQEVNQRLRREIERLQSRLKQAETIIECQKKLSEMLGMPLDDPRLSGNDE